jgi:hypothetical protein
VDTETRFSATMLAAAIPDWVDLGALAAVVPHGYGMPIPPDAGSDLRAAAALHQLALAPSTSAEREEVLVGMRFATIVRDEAEEEAAMCQKLLRVHLQDVPIDILRDACHAYVNQPGRRFYPKSAGELRTFTNPPMIMRRSRAFHLLRLAEEADRADAERERLAGDPLTPEAMREILAQHGIGHKLERLITPGAAAA